MSSENTAAVAAAVAAAAAAAAVTSAVAAASEYPAEDATEEDAWSDRSRSTAALPRLATPHMQGLTLVHISSQPEPVLIIEATASIHFPA